MMHTIIYKSKNALLQILSKRMGKAATRAELYSKSKDMKLPELTVAEKEAVSVFWKGYPINWRYWKFYKKAGCFSADLVPDDLYTRFILRVLNPLCYSQSLHVKNLYPIFFTALEQPKVLINRIGGVSYDSKQNILSEKEALHILKSVDKLIIKPTSGSCGGDGIKIVSPHSCSVEDISNILKDYGHSYICQEILEQSELTAQFNRTSLNTFRINTLNLNGKITVENIMFRHGRNNSIVDNFGLGGVCCGVNNDGTFIGRAIDASLNNYDKTPFGVSYCDIAIPETSIIVDYAIRAHRQYLPMIGHAAWDFALSETNNPVFIEVNLGWPGLVSEQLSSGRSIFNDRVDEVLAYAQKYYGNLRFTDFLGNWL